MKVKSMATVTLLGDVVDSRGSDDRPGMHRALTTALRRVDTVAPSEQGLAVTVGDEFQATYATLGAALDAALRVRLSLLPDVDVRIGVGRGQVVDLDRERGTALRAWRVGYRAEEPAATDEAINAALICQDQLIGSLSERALRLLGGLLDGRSQAELAEQEGITASAVSQQVRSHGIGAILHAHELLRRLP
jgi:DNA-binding CsgD family transcriptional regulator